MRQRCFAIIIGITVTLLALTSCSDEITNNTNPSSDCQLLLQQQQYIQTLANSHIQVIQQGEETTLILPSDSFFSRYSNHMLQNIDTTLNTIIDFMNTYKTIDIQVTGYTDNIGDSVRNLALSRAQAQAIVNYLLANGLSTRLISAQGKGCAGPIASNIYASGRQANRRIEIFFRLPPPDNVFN